MDLDEAIIFKLLESSDAWKQARRLGLKPELLKDEAKAAYEFAEKYLNEYGTLPGLEVVASQTGCLGRPVEATMEFVVDELFNRRKFWLMKTGHRKLGETLVDSTPAEAEELIIAMAAQLQTLRAQRSSAVSMPSLGEVVWQRYLDMKSGKTGIPFPWPSMTAQTMGMWPKTMTFFVGRPGSGKTFSGVDIALNAWAQGYRVLVISPEMTKEEIAERFFSMYAKVPYAGVVNGGLLMHAEEHLKQTIESVKGMDGFWIVDADDHLDTGDIEQAVEMLKPHLLVLDSVYMLNPGGKGDRHEKIIKVVEWASHFCKRAYDGEGIPILGISQLARPKKKDTSGSISGSAASQNMVEQLRDQLALSDAILWYVHNLFGIVQDDDMRADKQLLYVPLKIRRAVFRKEVRVRWDMDEMDFSEIGVSAEDGYQDDDFDATTATATATGL